MSDLHRRAARGPMLRARAELRAAGDGDRQADEVTLLLLRLDAGEDLEAVLDQFDAVIASYRPTVVPLIPSVEVLLP